MEELEPELKGIGYTYVVGISGISSSGKTTLARHLQRLFTNLTIPISPISQPGAASNVVGKISFNISLLHEDDFFFPESSLPVRRVAIKHQGSKHEEPEETVDMVDWDFPGAINFRALKKALRLLNQGVPYAEVLHCMGIKETEGPEPVEVQPDAAPKGGVVISEAALAEIRKVIISKLNKDVEQIPKTLRKSFWINLILVDGFMLYHRDGDEAEQTSPTLASLLDLKLLLRAPYAVAKGRRESRNGYHTADGFWTDPPGYFDGIVWPNYVQYHRHLFVEGDVDAGTLTDEWGPKGKGVELQPGHEGMEDLLRWASGKIVDVIAGAWINYLGQPH